MYRFDNDTGQKTQATVPASTDCRGAVSITFDDSVAAGSVELCARHLYYTNMRGTMAGLSGSCNTAPLHRLCCGHPLYFTILPHIYTTLSSFAICHRHLLPYIAILSSLLPWRILSFCHLLPSC